MYSKTFPSGIRPWNTLLLKFPQLQDLGPITFRVGCRRREMYIGHVRLCVCLSVITCPHYWTDPDVTWGNGSGAS